MHSVQTGSNPESNLISHFSKNEKQMDKQSSRSFRNLGVQAKINRGSLQTKQEDKGDQSHKGSLLVQRRQNKSISMVLGHRSASIPMERVVSPKESTFGFSDLSLPQSFCTKEELKERTTSHNSFTEKLSYFLPLKDNLEKNFQHCLLNLNGEKIPRTKKTFQESIQFISERFFNLVNEEIVPAIQNKMVQREAFFIKTLDDYTSFIGYENTRTTNHP